MVFAGEQSKQLLPMMLAEKRPQPIAKRVWCEVALRHKSDDVRICRFSLDRSLSGDNLYRTNSVRIWPRRVAGQR